MILLNTSKFFVLFSLVLSLLIVSSLSVFAADVPGAINQKITDYKITLEVSGKVHVIQSFYIESLSEKPIVPGFAKLTLFSGADPKNIVVDIDGSIKQLENYELVEGRPVIYYDVWRPISPGEKLKVSVSFDLENFIKKGIFFQELEFELGSLVVPVDSAAFYLKLPKDKYVSFSDPKYISSGVIGEFKTYEYQIVPGSRVNAEFSSIPLPTLPFNGYWIWSGFAVICLMYFVVQAIKVVLHIKTSASE